MRNNKIFAKALAVDMLFVCYSLSLAIVAQVFDAIKESYALSLAKAGMLLSMQSIGGLAIALMCTLFLDAFHKRKVLVIAGLLFCISFLLIGMVPYLWVMFFIFIVVGFTGGIVNLLSNSVIVETVPRHPEKYMNAMHMLFSVAAAAAPFVSQWIYASSGIPGVFYGVGAFMLAWAVYALYAFRADMGGACIQDRIHLTVRLKQVLAVYKKPGMGQVFLIAILLSSWQLAVMYYISTLFTGINGNPNEGALALSVLFVGMMAARLLYTRVAHRFSQGRVLAWGNLLGAFAWAAAICVPGYWSKIALVGVSALCCGNNFPLTYMAACKIAPQNTATASGTVGLGYYVSLFLFVPLVGALGDRIGLNHALLVTCIPLLLAFPVALALHRKMKSGGDA